MIKSSRNVGDLLEPPLHGNRGDREPTKLLETPLGLTVAISREAGARGGSIAKRVGKRLGWHTDQTEETQYIVSGTGELVMDEGRFPVGPGSVFVLPTNVGHDLVNTGTETLRCVGFFGAAMFTQVFDNVMLPPNTHVLGTPNRDGTGAPPPRPLG